MSAALVVAFWSATRLARCASVGRTAWSISAVGHSITPGCAVPQLWASEPVVFVRSLALTLIIAECGQPRLLLVAQEAVEFLQRWLHRRTAVIIASMRCCIAASRLGAVSAISVGQAALMSCAALSEALARSSSAARCASVGWIACWN